MVLSCKHHWLPQPERRISAGQKQGHSLQWCCSRNHAMMLRAAGGITLTLLLQHTLLYSHFSTVKEVCTLLSKSSSHLHKQEKSLSWQQQHEHSKRDPLQSAMTVFCFAFCWVCFSPDWDGCKPTFSAFAMLVKKNCFWFAHNPGDLGTILFI